jgi:hypothetical protein
MDRLHCELHCRFQVRSPWCTMDPAGGPNIPVKMDCNSFSRGRYGNKTRAAKHRRDA